MFVQLITECLSPGSRWNWVMLILSHFLKLSHKETSSGFHLHLFPQTAQSQINRLRFIRVNWSQSGSASNLQPGQQEMSKLLHQLLPEVCTHTGSAHRRLAGRPSCCDTHLMEHESTSEGEEQRDMRRRFV
ncbi:unnamed protein product [Pleuronectes platessa]|uniref:Uncharacterized protein n=1 Tax=Pleuronectes platessa TaxID=8262 RepID=A0A9N7UIL0_PLEPL|nr:unnamed protein product [Pleuronectes platessa]